MNKKITFVKYFNIDSMSNNEWGINVVLRYLSFSLEGASQAFS